MAIVTRYFSTAAAGAGDGTTWADRAQLINAGTWSAVITAFDFSGSDSLLCLIGPGTHTATAAMASGLFSVAAPTAANPIIFHGCDSSGVALVPPDPDWVSAQAVYDDSGFPVLASTTNIATINLAHCYVRLVKFTASGATTAVPITNAVAVDWITLYHSGSNTAALGIGASMRRVSNSYVIMTGASYSAAIAFDIGQIFNCRVSGIGGGGTSGNRNGFSFAGTTTPGIVAFCTAYGFAGNGVGSTTSTAGHFHIVSRGTFVNNTGSGVSLHATAAQTAQHRLHGCQITGNGAYGIDAQSAARLFATDNRLRDNTSGNLGNMGNYPTSFDNYTTDSDDATEYVDSSTYDFRIKTTAATWGKGYGAGDQPASGGGNGLLTHPGMAGRV